MSDRWVGVATYYIYGQGYSLEADSFKFLFTSVLKVKPRSSLSAPGTLATRLLSTLLLQCLSLSFASGSA